VRFQILTAASMKTTDFRDFAPRSLVEVYRRFRGVYWLNHQGDEWLFILSNLVIFANVYFTYKQSNNQCSALLIRVKPRRLTQRWRVYLYSECVRFGVSCFLSNPYHFTARNHRIRFKITSVDITTSLNNARTMRTDEHGVANGEHAPL
jgi:hypothetical protein